MLAFLKGSWIWPVLAGLGLMLANLYRVIWQRNRAQKALEHERANREWAEALARARDEVERKSTDRAEAAQEALDEGKVPDHLANPREH